MYMCISMYIYMCGEIWLATKYLNSSPQFSRLGIQVSLANKI